MKTLNKRKLAIIGTVGLPANYGGFETLADHLVKGVSDTYDISVYCSAKRYPKSSRKKTYNRARLFYIPLNANGFQSIFYDTFSIIHALFYADLLLILGVSGAWFLPFVRIFTKKKIIISIDGIEWKRSKWNLLAKWYLWWAEKLAVQYAHIDISDNESIQDYTAMRYGSLSQVIEYGADHTLRVTPQNSDYDVYPFLKKEYAFKVCRIEPENNIDVILESFARTSKMPLVCVGNWENSTYGIELKSQYQHHEQIILLDPIYNQRELDLIRGNASMYIHGHSAGGTNPSLVEAMYLGLPIIAYKVSYNITTTEGKAQYFSSSEELMNVLLTMTRDKRKALGKSMKRIADRRYTWNVIIKKYKFLFDQVFLDHKKSLFSNASEKMEFNLLREVHATHLMHSRTFFES